MSHEKCDLFIVGTSIDSHIASVLDELPDGIRVARLDVDQYPKSHTLSIDLNSAATRVYLRNEAGTWDITTPKVAWFRRLGKPGLQPNLADRYRGFVLGETEHQLEGVLSLVRPTFWMNPYWETRAAANKLRQLEHAIALGLEVPETWVGNDPQLLKGWMTLHRGAIIAKSLHSPLVSGQLGNDGMFTFTSLLTDEDRGDVDDVSVAPTQFQPFLQKEYELRVTSVRGKHFAARINTVKSGLDDLDWRADKYTVESTDLPAHTSAALSALLTRLGLTYAASDFIVTPDGRIVFLECNPHGAWLWLERQIPEYSISQEIATLFASFIV